MNPGLRPYPPADISVRPLSIWRIPKGAILHRFYRRGLEPSFYGKGLEGRLNAPDGSYGVLYTGWTLNVAFAESFLRSPGRAQLPSDLVAARAYVSFQTIQPLRVVRLYGRWMAALGATGEVTSGGPPYDLSQAWSKALHSHPGEADGIAYYARHDNSELSVALFDRARTALVEARREPDLHQDWFWNIAEQYGVGSYATGAV